MRVLVIGATGFIGTRVVDELVLGHRAEVRATVRDYRKAIRLGRLPVEFIEASASNLAAMREAADGCDAVVHCAHPFSSANESSAALDLCRAAAAAAAATTKRRLVYVSSTAIYGMGVPEISDDTPPRPETPYGRLKLRCERLLRAEHDAGSIRLVVLRPSIVYGPFSPSWTISPARQMAEGDLILPVGASGACNAIYIDDVAQAVARATLLDTALPVLVNLAAPDRPSWRNFYRAYEGVVHPGAVKEWPVDAIHEAIAARKRERRSWRAVQRALTDRRVRDRLNEIPVLAGLNSLGKSLGWRGLPPAEGLALRRASDTQDLPARVEHLPDPVRFDLYVRAPRVHGKAAASLLGLKPRDLKAGMTPTCAWLAWAGLSESVLAEARLA
jgi:nucleoside-diphosphate-sugar epimerase